MQGNMMMFSGYINKWKVCKIKIEFGLVLQYTGAYS